MAAKDGSDQLDRPGVLPSEAQCLAVRREVSKRVSITAIGVEFDKHNRQTRNVVYKAEILYRRSVRTKKPPEGVPPLRWIKRLLGNEERSNVGL